MARKAKKSRKRGAPGKAPARLVPREAWVLEPLVGLGPIRLGATREGLKALNLGRTSETDSRLTWDEARLQVSFSSAGTADHIGFTPDLAQAVVYQGVKLNGLKWEELIELFAPASFSVCEDDPTVTSCLELSLALWRRFDPEELRLEIADLEAEGADPEELASLREDAELASYTEQIALAVAGYWAD